MIVDGILEPMELAHLPYKKGRTYEDYVGLRAKALGKKSARHVTDVSSNSKPRSRPITSSSCGNAKLLKKSSRARLGDNNNAFRVASAYGRERRRCWEHAQTIECEPASEMPAD